VSPALRVLSPGLMTTVQDLGRPGYQRLGVPVSGALDPVSLRAANLLAGNSPSVGALEIAYAGPTLAIEADDVRLAFVGAFAAIDVFADETMRNGTRIAPMRSIRLRRGQVVRIGSLSGGALIYLAVEGGFALTPVLDSVSTYLRGGFGGLDGRALGIGDRLPLVRERASETEEHGLDGLDLAAPPRVRIMAGPQHDHFAASAVARLCAGEYTVGIESDRMGMRLAGPSLAHTKGFNITSDAIAPGSVQVPGNGQPIVLLADRQTTGGYPKIATVISADLPALGRLPIGAKIAFELVTQEAAAAARRSLLAEIEALPGRIRPLARGGQDIAARLSDCNLISGAVDALSFAA
jgi:biotin-dependent carboxylase-like uncharacterized protein